MNLRKSLVLGAGTTGKSILHFLMENKNKKIFLWDDDPQKLNSFKNKEGITCINPAELNWQEIERVFISPGIPVAYPVPNYAIELAKKNGCTLTNDIQLFCQSVDTQKTIGVTGTNGKSTTTKMIAHILNRENFKVDTVGNIGISPLECINLHNDFYTVEISSFQLEVCNNLALGIGILLDITPDHMNRYENFKEYVNAKAKIFENPKTRAIVSVNTKANMEIFQSLNNAEKIPISTTEILKNGFSMIDSEIFQNGERILCIKTKYQHHNENILASYVCGKLLGLSDEKLKENIKNFAPLPHRMEFITKYKNISFINDSKATNVESTRRALYLGKNIYWLAGGKLKGEMHFDKEMVQNVKMAYFFGEAKDALLAAYSNFKPCQKFGTLKQAFLKSFDDAIQIKEDVTILLSPCHPSFDEFRNFEERGNFFKELVLQLILTK